MRVAGLLLVCNKNERDPPERGHQSCPFRNRGENAFAKRELSGVHHSLLPHTSLSSFMLLKSIYNALEMPAFSFFAPFAYSDEVQL